MNIGFTGTKRGLPIGQTSRLIDTLIHFHYPTKGLLPEFHHGVCMGADLRAHEVVDLMEFRIHLHPPINIKFKANVSHIYTNVVKVWPEKEYLTRNKDIVNMCDILIACPFEQNEILRSGTWSTIRYARKQGKQIIIIKGLNK